MLGAHCWDQAALGLPCSQPIMQVRLLTREASDDEEVAYVRYHTKF